MSMLTTHNACTFKDYQELLLTIQMHQIDPTKVTTVVVMPKVS